MQKSGCDRHQYLSANNNIDFFVRPVLFYGVLYIVNFQGKTVPILSGRSATRRDETGSYSIIATRLYHLAGGRCLGRT